MSVCDYCVYANERSKVYCANCKYKKAETNPLNFGITLPGQRPNNPFNSNDMAGNTNRPFASRNWQELWSKIASDRAYSRHGIILTNTENCFSSNKEEFMNALDGYIRYKESRKTKYCILDMADQQIKSSPSSGDSSDVSFVVSVLKAVYDVAPIEYIMIVGDRSAINSAKWENGIYSENGNGDRDKYVDSDIPYVFLDTKSLFDGMPAQMNICVGRIPSTPKSGFSEAKAYFKNTIKCLDESRKIKACSLSAEEWEGVSRLNFIGAKPEFYSCPPHTFVEGIGETVIPRSTPYNLLCFNLHGAPVQNYWCSGDGTIGMLPAFLPSDPNTAYVIGTEACYGAKPVIREGASEQSILMTAITNRCVGFLGSTQIAYGITDAMLSYNRGPCCADVLVGHFSECVANGYTLGDAYLAAWKKLASNSNRLEEIKTLCSFALYGDPTVVITASGEKIANKMAKGRITKPAINISLKAREVKVPDAISNSVDSYVKANFKEFARNKPSYFKAAAPASGLRKIANGGSDAVEYKATYAKSTNNVISILHLYFDAKGNVTTAFVSR